MKNGRWVPFSSLLHCHLFVFCHLLGEGLLAVFTDIMDAGSPVAVEQEGKHISDKVVVNLAFLHVFFTFGTSMDAFFQAALAYLAPLKPLGMGLA